MGIGRGFNKNRNGEMKERARAVVGKIQIIEGWLMSRPRGHQGSIIRTKGVVAVLENSKNQLVINRGEEVER